MCRDRTGIVDRNCAAVAGAGAAAAEGNNAVGTAAASRKPADARGVNTVGVAAECFDGRTGQSRDINAGAVSRAATAARSAINAGAITCGAARTTAAHRTDAVCVRAVCANRPVKSHCNGVGMTALAAVASAAADTSGVTAISAVTAHTRSNDARRSVTCCRNGACRRDRDRAPGTAVATTTAIASDIGITTAAAIAATRCHDDARCIRGDDRARASRSWVRTRLRVGQGQVVATVSIVTRLSADANTTVAAIAAVVGARVESQSRYAARWRNVGGQRVDIQSRDGVAVVADTARDIASAIDDAITRGRCRQDGRAQAGAAEKGRQQPPRRSTAKAHAVPDFKSRPQAVRLIRTD